MATNIVSSGAEDADAEDADADAGLDAYCVGLFESHELPPFPRRGRTVYHHTFLKIKWVGTSRSKNLGTISLSTSDARDWRSSTAGCVMYSSWLDRTLLSVSVSLSLSVSNFTGCNYLLESESFGERPS